MSGDSQTVDATVQTTDDSEDGASTNGLSSAHYDWVQQFCGVDLRASQDQAGGTSDSSGGSTASAAPGGTGAPTGDGGAGGASNDGSLDTSAQAGTTDDPAENKKITSGGGASDDGSGDTSSEAGAPGDPADNRITSDGGAGGASDDDAGDNSGQGGTTDEPVYKKTGQVANDGQTDSGDVPVLEPGQGAFSYYFSNCMKNLGLPAPSSLFTTVTAATATAAAIEKAVTTFGTEVTIGELIGAGALSEALLMASACGATFYAGSCLSCAAGAAARAGIDKLTD